MIRLTCKCSECERGQRKETDDSGMYSSYSECQSCNGTGKTVIEFLWNEYTTEHLFFKNKISAIKYKLFWSYNGLRILDMDNNDITESLNPLFIEVIEEQECPECKGGKIFDDGHIESCGNCTNGKVEVVTQFTVFGSKKEYNEALIEKALSIISEQVIDFSGMEYDRGVDFMNNIESLFRKRILKESEQSQDL